MHRSCRLGNRRVRNQELGLARVKKFFNHFVHKDQLNDFWIKKDIFELVCLRMSRKRKSWQVLNVLKEAPTSPRFRGNKDTTFPPRVLE